MVVLAYGCSEDYRNNEKRVINERTEQQTLQINHIDSLRLSPNYSVVDSLSLKDKSMFLSDSLEIRQLLSDIRNSKDHLVKIRTQYFIVLYSDGDSLKIGYSCPNWIKLKDGRVLKVESEVLEKFNDLIR